MTAPAIEGILFDKDGTLFGFGDTWEAWAEAFLLRACARDRVRARRVGTAIGYDLEARCFASDSVVIAGTPQEVVTALGPHFTEYDASELLDIINDEAAIAPQSEAVPLRPLLDRLRAAGLRLGVATNDAEAPALAHLGAAGIRGRFDFVAGYDSGFGGKPAPGQMLGFCDAVGLSPEQVVMVGDSLHDLHAGRAAGMRTVGVLTGMAEHRVLAPMADAVLPDIGHLPHWLGLG